MKKIRKKEKFGKKKLCREKNKVYVKKIKLGKKNHFIKLLGYFSILGLHKILSYIIPDSIKFQKKIILGLIKKIF